MNLLFVTNNLYIPHLAVTLASIFENNKNIHFDIHILATSVSIEYQEKLKSFIERYGHTLDMHVINPNDLEINPKVCGIWGIYPSLKLYAADIFKDIDKILYVDIDMICIRSFEEKGLLDISLEDYYVAAPTDAKDGNNHKMRLGIPIDNFYGCAGFMYINLKKWREDNIREKCFSYFNNPQNAEKIEFGEQDVINKVCTGHILELPIEYNVMNQYYHHTQEMLPPRYISTMNLHKKNAIIIHFIGSCKPWFDDCRFPLRYYYWQYQKLTPWAGNRYGKSPDYKGIFNAFKLRVYEELHKWGIWKSDWFYDM